MEKDNPILIVGAGPTGLAMALTLWKTGVSFRIIEKRSGPGEASRALVVQARILEHYQQLGFADKLVEAGIPLTSVHLREGNEDKAAFKLSNMGKSLSPFPYVLSLPQDVHEQLLVKELEKSGVQIEWNTELVSFTDEGNEVHAILEQNGEEEHIKAAYLCGCDGAHSTVRHRMKVEFPGGTYDQLFFVADVEANSEELIMGDFYMYMDGEGFLIFMPVRRKGIMRIIGIVPEQFSQQEEVGFWDIYPSVKEKIHVDVTNVNWFSKYRVHHRVSEHFKKGRVFIAGDAGHIHSPAGGQGMNTGIGDAINLAWKLASVVKGKAAVTLLDTYETERIGFAKTLVSTTDKAFTNIIGNHLRGRLIRTIVFPYVIPFLLGFSFAQKGAFKTLSQTRIHYQDSDISEGEAGNVKAGERLPWVELDSGDNFKPLQSFDWQVHVYGVVEKRMRDFLQSKHIDLHVFPWSKEMEKAGFKEHAVYLLRPDGYVAFAAEEQDVHKLDEYFTRFTIRSLFS